MRWGVLLLAAGLAAGVALSGCLGAPMDPGTQLPPGHDEHHAATTPPTEEFGPADVTLEAHAGMPEDELEFHPNALQVQVGSVVEVRVKNEGRLPHTFTVHPFDADTGTIVPGEERVLTFLASEVGTFEIMCDVPGHYQSGMKASLEVIA